MLGYLILWLGACLWATSFVMRRVESVNHRVVYYILIWCFPLIGAIAAILIPSLGTNLKQADSTDKMFEEVVESRRDSRR